MWGCIVREGVYGGLDGCVGGTFGSWADDEGSWWTVGSGGLAGLSGDVVNGDGVRSYGVEEETQQGEDGWEHLVCGWILTSDGYGLW